MLKNLVLIGLSFIVGCFVSMYFLTSFEVDIYKKDARLDVSNKHSYEYLQSNFTTSKEVYICKGPRSKRYHYKKSCRGLKPCSTDIFEVSMSKAKELGRTLCGWED
ncbi:hypothetical protein [uncultured Dokdonia sp.]|uniref:hypothetical protein n=1 Tax=uncultured Dokdonia sp. TaxID=575653 RepID=UPI00262DFB39|nr:hypothetical protein [uncultured Dokdonia sp.]